ncbi:CaiB/BaiF CoA transferase family protein [Desulfotignum balticum]|uniref:CaiB/BaiF CoA transferase family protein n=1 Tax=Desulfotignum balticum TaxID=115781 RepID=UPI000462C14E|nr:CoA transferase [Desulfotignum balticum]
MGLLKDIRITDFTRVVAGPYCTRMLADFGAEVIKVQSKKTAVGAEDNTRGYFGAWNRNKKSISLNMAHSEARDLAEKLVAVSDVVVENFSPRVMENWKLDYPHMKLLKKDIILLSLSGMGHTGPWKNHVAFGATIQALSGFSHLTAYDENTPVGSGFAYADIVSGIYGAIAVMAALEYRTRNGKGMHIDLSEYEVMCSLLGPELMAANQPDLFPRSWGNESGNSPAAPHGCYPCRGTDRWCVIAVFDDNQWAAFCQVLNNPDWMREKKFTTLFSRISHADELDAHIREWTAVRNAESVVSALQKAGIPAGVVKDAHDLAIDPHLRERRFFTQMQHPVLGNVSADTSPIRFKNMPRATLKSSPLLGQDNQSIFVNLLGLSETEFADYIQQGIIG